MLDSPDIKLVNPRTHGHESMIKDLIIQGNTEPAARDKIAEGFRTMRSTPMSNKLFIEKRKMLKEAQEQSLIDPLTGLFNRRYLGYEVENPTGIGELQREFDEAFRSNHDLSSFMIDIDDFKQYNDTYGHPEGDRVLRVVANTIKKIIRDTDIPFRYGGEEFFILSPETNIDGAKELANRLNEAIANIPGLKRGITVSIGIASFHNSDAYRNKELNTKVTIKEDLIIKSDDALYYSKFNGKNRATSANDLTEEQYEEIERLREEEIKKKATLQE